MGATSWVHITVDKIVKETENAFLFEIDGEQEWFPKSQVCDPETYEEGDKDCSVSVTEWIAKQKGLET